MVALSNKDIRTSVVIIVAEAMLRLSIITVPALWDIAISISTISFLTAV